MNTIKKLGKSLLYLIIPSLIFTFLLTLLNYFDIISYHTLNIIKYILFFITLFISSYIFGKNSINKGIIEGFKYGLIIVFIFMIFNYFIINTILNIKTFIYYLGIIGTSILGSIIGINRKK